ncbi:MAG: PTS sugar transporter subunit IIA [Calditrichaceae bacterium]|jgi:fructose-specific phosphotransferase system IIA component
MRLTDILLNDYIKIPLDAKDRDDAIKKLVMLLGQSKVIDDTDQAYKAVLDREKIMTTGVGNGIAIPHCKDSSCPNFAVAMGVHNKGLNFESIDKKDVRIIFLLVGPENNPGLHIKLLSRISRLMSNEDLRDELLDCKTAEDALNLLQEEENYYFDLD